jgi:hypothetical protein
LIAVTSIVFVAFAWVALRAALLTPTELAGWEGSLICHCVLLAAGLLVIWRSLGEFVARVTGDKAKYGFFPYQFFLFAPVQLPICAIILTIAIVFVGDVTYNMAMLPTEESFVFLVLPELVWLSDSGWLSDLDQFPEGTIVDVAGDLWDQNHSLWTASLVFVIFSWVGIAGLFVINVLSKLNIRPGAKRVSGEV